MHVELDFRSGTPLYVQLVEQIKCLIATGALQPGDRLPPVRRLADDLRVNFNTIARAYRILDDEAVISTQHGRGTFILDPAFPVEASTSQGISLRRQDTLQALAREYVREASLLGCTLEQASEALANLLDEHQEQA